MRELKFRGKLLNDSNSFKTYKKGIVITGGFCNQGIKCFIVAHFNVFEVDPESVQQFTGFKDRYDEEIFGGVVLSDYTQTDEGLVQSKMQVFWCEKIGAWKLDNSYHQDKSSGDLLSDELADFNYEVVGNVCENPELCR
jgi:hypothetical protein